MKRVVIIILCFLSILLSFVLSPLGKNAQAQDFSNTYIDPDWGIQIFKTLPFTTAAISFDSQDNLYASNIFNDWGPGIKNILRLQPPEYDSPLAFLSYDTVYDAINGMDFDRKGNLFVSEFMGINSDSDLGAIRKIYALANQVSEPIEFMGNY